MCLEHLCPLPAPLRQHGPVTLHHGSKAVVVVVVVVVLDTVPPAAHKLHVRPHVPSAVGPQDSGQGAVRGQRGVPGIVAVVLVAGEVHYSDFVWSD
jgi:hypothetical protein